MKVNELIRMKREKTYVVNNKFKHFADEIAHKAIRIIKERYMTLKFRNSFYSMARILANGPLVFYQLCLVPIVEIDMPPTYAIDLQVLQIQRLHMARKCFDPPIASFFNQG